VDSRNRPTRGLAAVGPGLLTVAATLIGCFDSQETRLMSKAEPASHTTTQPADAENLQTATFAAGCFWGVEATFRKVPGVRDVTVGYTGGRLDNPTYRQVCTDRTGHAEAVQVVYDPAVVTYDQLLDVFWACHDPTQVNRQGPDFGTQYRSAIFFHTPEQEAAAVASKKRLEESGKLSRPIATEITEAPTFWRAEEYHQRYYEKHGIAGCPR
jgi:peptide-methionine (S)-S-oxide reductase